MTFTVSPWLMFAGACLVLSGATFWAAVAWRGVRDAAAWVADLWRWWWRDRVTPLLEDDTCPECGGTGVHEWDCPVDPALDPLPPERSWEELTYHRPPLAGPIMHLPEHQERRAPKWEAEARGHYVAMGLDYPSGLMARVRELTP